MPVFKVTYDGPYDFKVNAEDESLAEKEAWDRMRNFLSSEEAQGNPEEDEF